MTKRMTPDEARAEGYEVDSHCYPWIAYKGPRFAPTEIRRCFTDDEAALLEVARLAYEEGVAPRDERGQVVPPAEFGAMTAKQIDEKWDFDDRWKAHRIAQAIAKAEFR